MEYSVLGIADYVVFATMLLISAGIGLYYRFSGGKQQTANEYILGNQTMGVIPVAFSLMASFMSAITLLGVSNENYSFGTQFVLINFSYGLATPFAAYIYLPIFYRLRSMSAYEYLERRFGKATRIMASLAFSIQMIMYMGIVLYAPAIALSAVTGLSYFGSILAVGACCTFYSTLGGIKAVLITDVFQSLLMFGSIFAVIIVGSLELGGLHVIFERASEGERLQFFEVSPDPTVRHTVWTQIIGGAFTYLSIYAVNQAQVQRLLTIGTLKKSQMALWVQWPILTFLSLSTSLAGLTIYAYYQGCDPVSAERIKKSDQLLPLFVVDTMSKYPGLTGLFIAGIFSGSLSTVSSAINSLAAVTLEDYINPIKPVGDSKKTLVLKGLVFLYGVICVILAFLSNAIKSGVLQASLTVFGVVGGPLLGLFSLGMFFKKPNQIGSLIGFISSLVFLFWIGFGKPKPPLPKLPVSTSECKNYVPPEIDDASLPDSTPIEYFYLYKISYAWYALIGFVITLIVGGVTSLLFRNLCPEDPHPDLLVSWKKSSSSFNVTRKEEKTTDL